MKVPIAVFIGTRPEAVKMAPVVKALQQSAALEPLVIATGQHREMLRQVVELFEIPIARELDVMQPNQTLAGLTARLITVIDQTLTDIRPAASLVQGDTTTVLAASLASFYQRIPVGHVEAGLRTGNLSAPFPEEANRRLASPLVKFHFAPTELARQNLLREGIDANSICVTGNTVIDALHLEVARQSHPEVEQQLRRELDALLGPGWTQQPLILVTGHRRESFGDGFLQICQALSELAERHPQVRFVYPVHLNPNVQQPVYRLLGDRPNITLTAPLSYRPFVALLRACRFVVTDSGGVQEEAPGLGKPVLVMRETTERPEGVTAGTVQLVGADAARIVAGVERLLTDTLMFKRMSQASNPYGDGRAAQRIVAWLDERLRV